MLVSYSWLREFVDLEGVGPEEAAHALTMIGLEAEEVTHKGQGLDSVVVAEVVSARPVEGKQNLKVVTVNRGEEKVDTICGAPNVPDPGGRVALALVGARLPAGEVEEKEFNGIVSRGFLCSEKELGTGEDADGLLILDDSVAPGTILSDAYPVIDAVLDIGVTPNRGDCLSHRGMARELAIALGRDFNTPAVPTIPIGDVEAGRKVEIEIQDPDLCPRYMGAVVSGISIKPSPFLLRYRLHILGLRPINNVVDATNLMLLEFGQPFHAFDLKRIRGGRIIVRRAEDAEKIRTLDDVDRKLSPDDLVIADAEGPVAIAGVMGGFNTEVEDDTTQLLLECANFNPVSIRKTSKKLKLISESSIRFERGVDVESMEEALGSLTSMMCTLGGGTAAEQMIDRYPRPYEGPKVSVRPARYEHVVGMQADAAEIMSIMHKLGMDAAVVDSGKKVEVRVPARRPDIRREEDLIEEVARVQGYDRLPSLSPHIKCTTPAPAMFSHVRRARGIMTALGIQDTLNYTFVSGRDLEILEMPRDLSIANPLKDDRAHMRTSLLVALLEDLKRAINQRIETVRIFEAGPVFHSKAGAKMPVEDWMLSGAMWGRRASWMGTEAEFIDFYDAKGVVESFVRQFCGECIVLEPCEAAHLHPASCSSIMHGGKSVGMMGELNPMKAEALDLPRDVFIFEMDMSCLIDALTTPVFTPLPRYPSVSRDVALLLDADITAGRVMRLLEEKAGALATGVEVFDVYRGKQVPDGQKSMAFRVTYRSDERTLTDEEVDDAHAGAVRAVVDELKAQIR